MESNAYDGLFQEKLQSMRTERPHLQSWQCRLELKRVHPGLYQAVFGRDQHERFMGAVDFHLSEGYSVEEACDLIGRNAPELAEDMPAGSLENA